MGRPQSSLSELPVIAAAPPDSEHATRRDAATKKGDRATFTVIIPAYNEEGVIRSCLEALQSGLERCALPVEALVVCNGCSDRTAEIARSMGEVVVLETAAPSKVRAINMGLCRAAPGPVMVMDADIRLGGDGVRGMVAALQRPNALAAAPRAEMEYAPGTPWMVRAYYRLWLSLSYVSEGMIGCGTYGLSESGRRRVGELPNVIADDGFVRACFSAGERVRVDEVTARVRAPRSLADLIRIKTRSRLGSYQLSRLNDPRLVRSSRGGRVRAWLEALCSPSLWPCMPVYVLVNVASRLRAGRQLKRLDTYVWERDESARTGALQGEEGCG